MFNSSGGLCQFFQSYSVENCHTTCYQGDRLRPTRQCQGMCWRVEGTGSCRNGMVGLFSCVLCMYHIDVEMSVWIEILNISQFRSSLGLQESVIQHPRYAWEERGGSSRMEQSLRNRTSDPKTPTPGWLQAVPRLIPHTIDSEVR
jgi:hypothetical protein